MASRPPGPPMPPGGAPGGAPPAGADVFSGAPPSPGAGPKPGAGAPGEPPTDPSDPQSLMKGVITIASQIGQVLQNFGRAMPEGAQKFRQADQLIQEGIAEAVAAAASEAGGGGMESPASSPTNPGNTFPGGGIGGAARP